jgi:hypothetical protein
MMDMTRDITKSIRHDAQHNILPSLENALQTCLESGLGLSVFVKIKNLNRASSLSSVLQTQIIRNELEIWCKAQNETVFVAFDNKERTIRATWNAAALLKQSEQSNNTELPDGVENQKEDSEMPSLEKAPETCNGDGEDLAQEQMRKAKDFFQTAMEFAHCDCKTPVCSNLRLLGKHTTYYLTEEHYAIAMAFVKHMEQFVAQNRDALIDHFNPTNFHWLQKFLHQSHDALRPVH